MPLKLEFSAQNLLFSRLENEFINITFINIYEKINIIISTTHIVDNNK